MVNLLATQKPREALQFFAQSLEQPHAEMTEVALFAQAHLFLEYRQGGVAFEAVKVLHERGYAVPPLLASELLEVLSAELERDQDALIAVLGWFSDGLLKGRASNPKADVQLVQTVFSVLSRLGRNDWLSEVFRLYRGTLKDGEVGSTRLWTAAIAAKLQDGEVKEARTLFNTWRTLRRSRRDGVDEPASTSSTASKAPRPPPPGPYIALLNYYADNVPSLPASRDPAYLFLSKVREDGLASSPALLNALLRLELRRHRFSSFWGLWQQFEALSLARNPRSWELAIQAVTQAESVRLNRQRGRKHNSPLLASSPFPYTEVHTPSARHLFRTLLSDHLARTSHHPARRSPSPSFGPRTDLVTPTLLNSFLDLFVARSDWTACVVVLETFAVHRLEPDARTHGSVVVGVVKQWERGRLQGRLKDEEDAIARLGDGGYGGSEEGRIGRSRFRALGGPDSLAMIRTILEGRKVRAGLWAGPSATDDAGGEDDLAARIANPPPLREERLSEMRDTKYLASLLRRCAGVEYQWKAAMAETRREMLPESKVGDRADEEGVRKRITKRRRWEHLAYGASLRK
ncbi:hypothetical protein JCM6882_005516 [Rhodosporidiobolus microsporus]